MVILFHLLPQIAMVFGIFLLSRYTKNRVILGGKKLRKKPAEALIFGKLIPDRVQVRYKRRPLLCSLRSYRNRRKNQVQLIIADRGTRVQIGFKCSMAVPPFVRLTGTGYIRFRRRPENQGSGSCFINGRNTASRNRTIQER